MELFQMELQCLVSTVWLTTVLLNRNFHLLVLKVIFTINFAPTFTVCISVPAARSQHPPGAVGGVMPLHETVATGRGYGRGRGRSLLTPARQPNTQPPPMMPVGRGIGSLTSRTLSNNVLTF